MVFLNVKIIDKISDRVYECLGYFDEYTYSDALFIIEFALGMKKNYTPDEYMYEILDEFGIIEGCVDDEEVVEFLRERHIVQGEDAWGDSMVFCDLKEYLSNK